MAGGGSGWQWVAVAAVGHQAAGAGESGAMQTLPEQDIHLGSYTLTGISRGS